MVQSRKKMSTKASLNVTPLAKAAKRYSTVAVVIAALCVALPYILRPETKYAEQAVQNAKINASLATPSAAKPLVAASELVTDKVDTWHAPSDCAAWATAGECDKNFQFMETSCALSCFKLHGLRDAYAARCQRPADATPAIAPGTMRGTIERIMSDFGHLEPELISADPPVVLFHNFLSAPEADAFIAHGRGKYEESRGVGTDAKTGKMIDVKTEIRTSTHAWCIDSSCTEDPLVREVVGRVSDVTATPPQNSEYAQLVYYQACPEEGHPSCAFYKRHSDFIEGDRQRVQGERIYTLFMYLNDVEEGGGTRFTDLLPGGPVTFQPKRGKAVLWPSVLADAPHQMDARTHHEALPVTKGEKFGANFWIHMHDFKTPHATGCTA